MLENIPEWNLDQAKKKSNSCNDISAYIPDTLNAHVDNIKYIRLNMHFMNTSDWKSNYYGESGKDYAKQLIYQANRKLVYNKKMNLPEGNATPVYDPLYQYVLKDEDIYFHADDALCFYVNEGKNRNNYKRTVIDKYKVDNDSMLNVFYMVHHPDSIKSRTYSASAAGIALGKSIKLGTIYKPDDKPWLHSPLLNHEVGHVMGLSHAWNKNDGCEDTPPHPNCWAPTPTGKCKGVTSNNMMDYNSNQHAITPCQIGKMRKNMSKIGSKQRDLLEQRWCTLNPNKNVIISSNVHFQGAKDLEGNVIIQDGGQLKISCRLSMPAGSSITVEPGGMLILDNARLHNDCGMDWNGIVLQKSGKIQGEVYKNGDVKLENIKEALWITP
ncbi:hypothetical protein GCM10007940_37600 [Portibacter lacus]|uniref:Peptidase M43 pregnancy-associated plasma-A domain-containing protein n=2 Tax=Portibacter lacus TaxID=1099794 RepID=A0AA37ST21_9BACT|nr:hypothetical protein GCM10007940_37600 [Portibacter lacus]